MNPKLQVRSKNPGASPKIQGGGLMGHSQHFQGFKIMLIVPFYLRIKLQDFQFLPI